MACTTNSGLPMLGCCETANCPPLPDCFRIVEHGQVECLPWGELGLIGGCFLGDFPDLEPWDGTLQFNRLATRADCFWHGQGGGCGAGRKTGFFEYRRTYFELLVTCYGQENSGLVGEYSLWRGRYEIPQELWPTFQGGFNPVPPDELADLFPIVIPNNLPSALSEFLENHPEYEFDQVEQLTVEFCNPFP